MLTVIISNTMYQYDSRNVQPGDVFVCLPGGDAYGEEALLRGARYVTRLSRKEVAVLADDVYGHPSRDLCVIGITGTNGKTTVTHIVSEALKRLGKKPFLSGTLSMQLTTPEALDTHRLMAEHRAQGGTHYVMEVSSHAIHQQRVFGIDFDVKVLTNITQDHLDYHKDFETYKAVKMSFMTEYSGVSIYPEDFLSKTVWFEHRLIGGFNEENMQAAARILSVLGFNREDIATALGQVGPPPGRFEQIYLGQPFYAVVDYAHTPDGLAHVLATARDLVKPKNGRVITVFGCGGDRDRGKRPQMAFMAEALSDIVVVTTDNPRNEAIGQIMSDICEGFVNKGAVIVEQDRRLAIQYALDAAVEGDIVMVTGKGHEAQQILNDKTIVFSDVDVVTHVLKERYAGFD